MTKKRKQIKAWKGWAVTDSNCAELAMIYVNKKPVIVNNYPKADPIIPEEKLKIIPVLITPLKKK